MIPEHEPIRVPRRQRGRRPRRQRGVTIALTALLLTSLCGAAALAVDVGMLCAAKNDAQNAADAAALAGAFTFLNPTDAQPTAADNAAIAIAAVNNVEDTPATISAADITVDTVNQRVTVSVPRTGANGISYFFAQALGLTTADLVATATAEASPVASGTACLRPIFVPNTILSAEQPAQACTDGQTILDSAGRLSPWLLANPSLIGSLLGVRPTSPSSALAPSQYYSIDFGGGASMYSCALGASLQSCGVSPSVLACGDTFTTETGNMVGPTKSGVNSLLGPTPDVWEGVGAYLHTDGTITDTSNQLIVAPVWDDCSSSIGPGQTTFPTIGFSLWFVDGMSGNTLDANFVDATACPSGGGGIGGPQPGATNGAFGIPIRLVTP